MNLDEFNIKRNLIGNKFQDLLKIACSLDNENLKVLIEESIDSLEKDNFNIVIVGEFSRGKSTFINALLSSRILPSSTKPTTTIINKILFGEEPRFYLYFRDNSDSKEISEAEFKAITAKLEPDYDDLEEIEEYKQHLRYLSNIAYADIKYPTQICKGGIEIVDTPGTNDLDEAREEITFKFIPQSDVAILLLSANQILSQSEVSFLKERILDNDIKKVFFVINFKDRLSSVEEEEKVISYATEHLKDIVDDPKIFMVSAKQALNYKRNQNGEVFKGGFPETLEETGFAHLESELISYLLEEKGKVKLNKYIDRGFKISNELLEKDIKLKSNVLNMSVLEFEKRVKDVQPVFEETKRACYKIIEELRSLLLNHETKLVNKYRIGLDLIANDALLAVVNYNGKLDYQLIARDVENAVALSQKKLQNEINEYKVKYVDEDVKRLLVSLQRSMDILSIKVNDVFNNDYEKLENVTLHEVEKLGGIDESQIFMGLFYTSLVSAVIAPFIALPVIFLGGDLIANLVYSIHKQDYINKMKSQVENKYKNSNAEKIKIFREDFKRYVDETIANIEKDAFPKINSLETQLNELLREKKLNETNVKKEMSELETYVKDLESIKKILKGITYE